MKSIVIALGWVCSDLWSLNTVDTVNSKDLQDLLTKMHQLQIIIITIEGEVDIAVIHLLTMIKMLSLLESNHLETQDPILDKLINLISLVIIQCMLTTTKG